MTRTTRRAAPALLVALAVAAAAGCGGGSDAPAASAPATDELRAGYFGADESTALNPPLAALNAAARTFDASAPKCDDEAVRLYKAGATPRKAVACHLRLDALMRDRAKAVAVAARAIEGDFRPKCERELVRYVATVDRLQGAWQRNLDHWNAYVRGERGASGRIMASANRARALTRAFLVDNTATVTLSSACYTAADLAAARASSTAAATTAPD